MGNETSVKKLLKNIGLGEKEALIYMELLKLNGSYPTILAKKCGINRSSIYMILDSLVSRDIITRTKKNGQFFYFPTHPRIFIRETREHQLLIQNTLDDLELLLEELASKDSHRLRSEKKQVITDLEEALTYVVKSISSQITDMAAIFLVDWKRDKIIPYKFTQSKTADLVHNKIKNIRSLSTPINKPVNKVGQSVKYGEILSGNSICDFICPAVSKELASKIQVFGKIESLLAVPIKINNNTIALALLGFNKRQCKKKDMGEIFQIINEGGIMIYHSLLITRHKKALRRSLNILREISSGINVSTENIKQMICELEGELNTTV